MRLLREEGNVGNEDPWFREFNGAFWLTMSGAFFGLIVAVLNAMIKSRCKRFSLCCGLFTAERNYLLKVINNKLLNVSDKYFRK